MYLNFILQNFELIVISIFLIITISTICILFVQNNFIKNTSNKIENYNDMIKKNNEGNISFQYPSNFNPEYKWTSKKIFEYFTVKV